MEAHHSSHGRQYYPQVLRLLRRTQSNATRRYTSASSLIRHVVRPTRDYQILEYTTLPLNIQRILQGPRGRSGGTRRSRRQGQKGTRNFTSRDRRDTGRRASSRISHTPSHSHGSSSPAELAHI
jgi:hypothetical protein